MRGNTQAHAQDLWRVVELSDLKCVDVLPPKNGEIRDSEDRPIIKFSISGSCFKCLIQQVWWYTSSTRTRRGGSCLKDIYETFLIYRTCMRRAPAKPVRACTLRKWCPVSHVTFEAPRHTSHLTVFTLHTTHCTLHTAHSTLHTSHSTLHTSHCTLHTSHCTLPTAHSTLRTPHFTLHSPHFTLRTPHFTLHSPHFTLHTPHFTVHTSHFTLHTSHCTLHAPHFTLHPSHSTLHLIWALLTLSQLISSHLISSHMSSKFSWITSQYYY